MTRSAPIVLPPTYFDGIHRDTATLLAQKGKGIRFSLALFSRLQRLVDLGLNRLKDRVKESECAIEADKMLDSYHCIDKAVDLAEAISDNGNIHHSRLLLLTTHEAHHLLWVLELAKEELDIRMASIEQCPQGVADEIEALYLIGLDEVVTVIKHGARDVVHGRFDFVAT